MTDEEVKNKVLKSFKAMKQNLGSINEEQDAFSIVSFGLCPFVHLDCDKVKLNEEYL